MMVLVDIVLILLAGIVLIPMTVLFLECLLALLPMRRTALAGGDPRPRTVVLIPAHNEEAGIGRTLAALAPQLQGADRVLVVADNCNDRTAEIARAAGVQVVERQDATQRGKGFALDHGIRQLDEDPPEVVVILDADTLLAEGSLDSVTRLAAALGRPVQAGYVLEAPPQGGVKDQLSAFAFRIKNIVRPLGMARLGLPCLLTGTGMAFPWLLIRSAPLATGNIVEDMKLGLDLAVAGQPPKLCSEARVSGELPSVRRAAVTQRTRWEHGHVQTLLTQVPRLVRAACRQRRLDLFGLALELSVPPLSMLFLLWAGLLAVSAGWWLWADSALPALLLIAGGFAVLSGIFASWVKFGRQQLPLSGLLAAPAYVLWKVPIYLSLLIRPQKAWVRTGRDAAPPADGPAPPPLAEKGS